MATIPEKYRDLFTDKKAFANLATLMPDGSPQVTPVWFGYENDKLTVNTALGRTKAKNMKQGASIALAILDPDNPYRYVQVRGRVARVTTDGADQHIDRLSHKYMGRDYPFRQPGDQRVIVEIEPVAVSASG